MKYEQFNPSQVKYLNGKLELKSVIEKITQEGTPDPQDYNVSSYDLPADILKQTIRAMRHYAAKVLGISDREEKFEATGVHISGTDDNRGVVISTKYTCPSGHVIAINTPRIVFSHNDLGFEEQVEKEVETILEETWEFFVNGKRGQYEIPQNEQVAEEEHAAS